MWTKTKEAIDLDAWRVSTRVHQALREVFLNDTLEPHLAIDKGDPIGAPIDVLPRPLKLYSGLEKKSFATFSEALDAFFVERENETAQAGSTGAQDESCSARPLRNFRAQEAELVRKGRADLPALRQRRADPHL